MLGTYEFSDFPMDSETYGVKPGEHIPGPIVHRYLTNFAEKFGIFGRIRFNQKIETAEHHESGGWLLTVAGAGRDEVKLKSNQIFTSKLIVATGMTSEPSLPKIDGASSFEAPLFHSKHFRQHAATLDTADRVCVFGGTKSAWDAVYEYAIKGTPVDWVIRESGHGPTWSKSLQVK